MNVTLALQRSVRRFPLGTRALAARLGVSETSLNHKVSPTYPTAHCSPEEMLEIMEITGDDGALVALADARHYVLLPAAADGAAGRGPLALVRAVREFGELAAQAASAMEDGSITGNELGRVQREAAEAVAAIHELVRVAMEMHEALRPTGLSG